MTPYVTLPASQNNLSDDGLHLLLPLLFSQLSCKKNETISFFFPPLAVTGDGGNGGSLSLMATFPEFIA